LTERLHFREQAPPTPALLFEELTPIALAPMIGRVHAQDRAFGDVFIMRRRTVSSAMGSMGTAMAIRGRRERRRTCVRPNSVGSY
jgi:hypothetical protein